MLSIVKIYQNPQVQFFLCYWDILIKADPIVLIVLKHKYLVSFMLSLTGISARFSLQPKLGIKFPENRMFYLDSSQIQMCLTVEHEGEKVLGH